jgi:hypothetical protein
MTVQESEIINLVMGLSSVLIFVFIFRKMETPRLQVIYTGFFFIIAGYIFTVVEGIFWHKLFNILEHLSYALAGLSFAVGLRRLSGWQGKEERPWT